MQNPCPPARQPPPALTRVPASWTACWDSHPGSNNPRKVLINRTIMKKVSLCIGMGLSLALLTACTGTLSSASPTIQATNSGTIPPEISTPALPAASPEGPTAPTLTPTVMPTFVPGSWQSLPVVPTVTATARQIYLSGRALNNDPHAFSIIGDCLSLPINLFQNFGKDPGEYNLGDFTSLQPAIDWFKESFNRQSLTLGDGFNTAAVLSPLRADPAQCLASETPLVCEYRIHRPSYVLISLGTDDFKTPPATYETRMRQIVEYSIARGVVPILATKADDREGQDAFNIILANLAHEYDLPLWNFWAAVQPLRYGLVGDEGHLLWADPNHLDYANSLQVAIPVRNLTALQTLDAIWRGVTAP
jgi:hypothetical protein